MKLEQTIGSKECKNFVAQTFSKYDTSKLKKFNISEHHSQKQNVGRFVYYKSQSKRQKKSEKKDSIYINLKTNSDNYPYTYERYARIPSETTQQGWESSPWQFELMTLDEAIVFMSMYFFFSYLSQHKLIKDENDMHIKHVVANKTWFAENKLAEYKEYSKNI